MPYLFSFVERRICGWGSFSVSCFIPGECLTLTCIVIGASAKGSISFKMPLSVVTAF